MFTDLVALDGGSFRMGSTQFYPEEAPVHAVTVAPFAVERHPVTNAQFGEFVADTGYRTVAEVAPDPALFPGAAPTDLVPGALVFRGTSGAVDLRDWRQWWNWTPGASWRHPYGPDSTIDGRSEHPVVQVCYADAAAYARWAGRRLPTEAEWEFAARAGSTATYAWGEEFAPGGQAMANIWQGRFPWENLAEDGYEGTSPVGAFPANQYGLYDMIGNVWEWTASAYGLPRTAGEKPSCCRSGTGGDHAAARMVKGGSHLCAPNYCLRYRPAARQSEPQDSSTTHIGFRCVLRAPPPVH